MQAGGERAGKKRKLDPATAAPKPAAAPAAGQAGGKAVGGAAKPGERTKPFKNTTKFHELLMQDMRAGNSRDAYLQDLKLQQQMEKRLGIKKVRALGRERQCCAGTVNPADVLFVLRWGST